MRKTDLEHSAGRVYKVMALLTIAGVVAAGIWAGVSSAAGFLLGSVFSVLNFWSWHRLVRRIGEPGSDGPRKASATAFGMRYVLFGMAGYATIHYFEASLQAALAGCFVAVAAVILEILLELIYGT